MANCCCAEWIGGLAREHAGRLARIARREGMTATEALDVVQDAFHTLIVRTDLRESPDEAAAVLGTIVRNAARNARRRHHRAADHAPIDDAPLVADTPPADELVARAEELEQLEGCMARLDDVHRHVVTLRVLEELSGTETADALGVSANHVAVLLYRARQQLADCMRQPA